MFLGALVRNPKIKAKMGNRMNEGMIAPYRKVVGSAAPEPEAPAAKTNSAPL
jgi:hypothetical protein